MEIYGQFETQLERVKDDVYQKLEALNKSTVDAGQPKLYEHLIARVKKPASMVEKCQRKGFDVSTHAALRDCHDSVGLRMVTNFIDDVTRCRKALEAADWCEIVEEKDYITNAKPNGYRSYHIIMLVTEPFADVDGNTPGKYYVEVQLRTIAMDTWASLEHEMKYKHHLAHPQRMGRELKRCADQLAACDVELQTIRQLIHDDDMEEQ